MGVIIAIFLIGFCTFSIFKTGSDSDDRMGY
jgi:hypothetical protein